MSISDKVSFQNAFKQHYTNLRPALYIWDKTSEFDDNNDRTTYKKEFTINSSTPYTFTIDDASNFVCDHNHNNTRQCKPDVVKCPIEHMMIIHNNDNNDTHTVFDFQPMSVRTTDDDRHGKNILKFRAEYGIFDADFHDDGKFKQNKMKKIVIYHPRYQLSQILQELEQIDDSYKYPFDPKKNYNGLDTDDDTKRFSKEETITRMGRRYIFLSIDYLSKNSTLDVSRYITDREKEMMINFYGVPGSDTMTDTSKWGNPKICSLSDNDTQSQAHWIRYITNNEQRTITEKMNLHECRTDDSNCHNKFESGGPFDRCHRCGDDCDGNLYVARPCARNVYYSAFDEENEYRPDNAIEKNGKVCPFDGYGTEIPDDVNDSEDVCWKATYLLNNWNTTCKDYTHFKKNYCAGAPENDLKMRKPDDYKNARYLTANVCNPTPSDMNGLCEWVVNNEYSGNISGHPVEFYCGCHKKTFVDRNKHDFFLSLQGNQAKLETVKKWSENSTLNDVFYDKETQTYGIQSTDKGIVEQIEPMCWPSCTTLKSAPINENRGFLTSYQNDSCTISACINMIEANDNTNLNLENIKQSCSYTSRYDDEEPSDDNKPSTEDEDDDDDNKDDESDTYWGLSTTQLSVIGMIILICCSLFFVILLVLIL